MGRAECEIGDLVTAAYAAKSEQGAMSGEFGRSIVTKTTDTTAFALDYKTVPDSGKA